MFGWLFEIIQRTGAGRGPAVSARTDSVSGGELKSSGMAESSVEVDSYDEGSEASLSQNKGVIVIDTEIEFDDVSSIIDDPFSGADSSVRAKELARSAVQCKEEDLVKAIKLMKEAVALNPTDQFMARLAYYYSLVNDKPRCLAIHAERLNRLSTKSPKHYFDAKIGILDDARKAHSRFQDSKRAILLEAECEFLRKVKKACEGIFSEEELENWRPFKGRALKKELKILELHSINSEEAVEALKRELVEVTKFYSSDLAHLAELARKLQKASADKVTDDASLHVFDAIWKRFASFDFSSQIKDRLEGGF
jgi:hypothetical protein